MALATASLFIICAQHLSGIGFSKSARPADTGQVLCRIDRPVKKSDQTSLIYIITANNSGKSTISRIQICSHVQTSSHNAVLEVDYLRMYLYIIHFTVIVPPYILLTHYSGEEFFVRDVHVAQY